MNNQQTSLVYIKTRILVVDNDPKSRVASQSLLLDWGYDPVLAMGIGSKLIADAKDKAR
jgi:CheY-like chemotaxis protein